MADLEKAKQELSRFVDEIERAAYQRGYDDAVKRILAAASPMISGQSQSVPKSLVAGATAPRQRAPMGMVGEYVDRVLQEGPEDGLRLVDVTNRVASLTDQISSKSVVNHLHRLRKKGKYNQLPTGKWVLAQRPQGSGWGTAGAPAPAATSTMVNSDAAA